MAPWRRLGDTLARDVSMAHQDHSTSAARFARRLGLGLGMLAAIALLATACKHRAGAETDAGVASAPGPTVEAESEPAPPRPAAFDAPDAAVFQHHGELLDQDVRQHAEAVFRAIANGDVGALGKETAPGVDAAALMSRLKGHVGVGPPRFEDAILTRDLIELRYKVTFDVDAAAPRYVLEVHLLFKRIDGFLPWRLTDAFVPGQ